MNEQLPIDQDPDGRRTVYDNLCDEVLEEYLRYKNNRYDPTFMEEALQRTVEEWYIVSAETEHATYRQLADTFAEMEAATARGHDREKALAIIARPRFNLALVAAKISQQVRLEEQRDDGDCIPMEQYSDDNLDQLFSERQSCAEACPYILELSRSMERQSGASDLGGMICIGGLGAAYIARRWKTRHCEGPLVDDVQTVCDHTGSRYDSEDRRLMPVGASKHDLERRQIHASLWAECYETQRLIIRENIAQKISDVLRGVITERDIEATRLAMATRQPNIRPTRRTHPELSASQLDIAVGNFKRSQETRRAVRYWDAYNAYRATGEYDQDEIIDKILADDDDRVQRYAENTFHYRLAQRQSE
jgi:hypothetical protein